MPRPRADLGGPAARLGRMAAPPVLRDVYHSLVGRRGEPDTSVVFEDGPGPIARLEVFVYRAAEPGALTTFTTVGMATAPMPAPMPAPGDGVGVGGIGGVGGGDGGRAELWLSRLGRVGPEAEHRIALRLANLAVYPWSAGRALGWGQIVGVGGDFPTFPGCDAAFLAGPLLTDTPDWVETSEGAVRIITVVPITGQERATARTVPPTAFLGDLIEARDVFDALPG